MYSVLFVCLGNICRSPTAEGIFRQKAKQLGLLEKIRIDSAGTSGFHEGAAPDMRSQQEAKRHGYDLSAIRSRKVLLEDFDNFDLLVAMDKTNQDKLKLLNLSVYNDKIKLFLENFAPQLSETDVPDPFYGGPKGFTHVVKLIEEASDGLLTYIAKEINHEL